MNRGLAGRPACRRGVLTRLLALALLGGHLACTPHRPDAAGAAPIAPLPGGKAPPRQTAFAVDGRVEAAGQSRKLKMRVFASAPGQFRIEVRGPIGGIALIATASEGKVRIVLPSKRRYAECRVQDDIGSGLVGIPLSGCDLAMVMRIASGVKRFQPCGGETDDPSLDAPPTEADRPGLIVDSTSPGGELVRFGFDWRGPGPFPQEARIELEGESSSLLALTEFRAIDYPAQAPEDFYWEPLPGGALRLSTDALAAGGAS